MRVLRATKEQLEAAAKAAGGMRIYSQSRDPKRFTLRPVGEQWRGKSASYYSRGRRVNAVCFHGHAEFFRQLFKIAPQAVVRSTRNGVTKWVAGDPALEEKFAAYGRTNVGPRISPVRLDECCDCGPMIQFGTLDAKAATLTNVRVLKQNDLLKCPFTIIDADHYRPDGSCKCDDPEERKKMIKEWGYTKASFKGVPLREG